MFTNPDADGFWDAIAASPEEGLLLGDPVDGKFALFISSQTKLDVWSRYTPTYLRPVFDHIPSPTETLFAASNSVLGGTPATGFIFVTGGERFTLFHVTAFQMIGPDFHPTTTSWTSAVPLAKGSSAGAFSFASNREPNLTSCQFVVVGGDYTKPDVPTGTAAYSRGGQTWKNSASPPHGYRSAVAYDEALKVWITVGPNGTDVSADAGKNWRALTPSAADAADADKNWNALSLPFVVGAKGRIGVLREGALAAAK